MSKNTKGPPAVDLSQYYKSTFTLTFTIEVLGMDVFYDCEDGWLELGPCSQGMKLQYQLYPGQTFDLDILIYPHVAKIWCGTQYGWVRVWNMLERRWFSFSIRHAFPVRVMGLQAFVATVTPTLGLGSLGSTAKSDKNTDVYLPPLEFPQRRYFAPVSVVEENTLKFVQDLIWSAVVEYIPASYLDGVFDVPHVVADTRHQDTCLEYVRDTILNRTVSQESEVSIQEEQIIVKPRDRRMTMTTTKDDKKTEKPEKKPAKPVEKPKTKFEMVLSGHFILSGAGKVTRFESVGDRPPDLGEIIVLISCNNLPAPDDYPIVFVNVDNLYGVPVNELKSLRITNLYTKWKIGDDEHNSQTVPIRSSSFNMNFNDHFAVALPYELVSLITAGFLDNAFEIQLRGNVLPPMAEAPKLFGYDKGDKDFGRTFPPRHKTDERDILIAVTKIDAKILAKSMNAFVRGEYPLFPPTVSVLKVNREGVCTNDINAIRIPVKPDLIVKPDTILLAQMTLDVCIGLVGCKPRKLTSSISRMFCVIKDSGSLIPLLKFVSDVNMEISESGSFDGILSGFAIDTGNTVIFYLEGPKDGHILRIWEMTEDLYPNVKPLFSCSVRYSTRLYPEFVASTVPFNVLKMFVPLGVLLACPPVYARPTLPLPTRCAILKIGRLLSKTKGLPSRNDMPTSAEIKSFRLELCIAPRPPLLLNLSNMPNMPDHGRRESVQSVSRINWEKNNM